MGDFSPDGKSLVYRAGRAGQRASGAGSGDWVLVIYSVETSGERIVWPSPSFIPDTHMYGPRWSPDGQSLLVCGTGQEGGHGLYTVDAETGTVKLIARDPTGHLISAVWSPDGESIYVRWRTSVGRLDPATGRETQLYQGGGVTKGLDVSPDGRWLAFYRNQDSLMVVSSGGGEPREVVHLDDAELTGHIAFVRWTLDGEHLLYPKRRNELWKVNIETGEQQQIGPVLENLVGVAMHPDGRQIALTIEQGGSELWVIENFLPD
jgi:Tol biopolymer transport system component